MPTRTIKLIGKCPTATNATFSFNGTEVFNGVLNITNNNDEGELFSFDIDRTIHGLVPGTLSITSGNATIITLSANYCLVEADAVLAEDGVTVETPAVTEADARDTYHWIADGSNSSKSNITINGEAYDKGEPSASYTGAWHIELTEGDTMVCDWNIFASPGYVPDPA